MHEPGGAARKCHGRLAFASPLLLGLVASLLPGVGQARVRDLNGRRVSELPPAIGSAENAGAPSNVQYHGGWTLNPAKVVPIFWGSYWQTDPGAREASVIAAFFDRFGESTQFDVLTEYYDTATGPVRPLTLTDMTFPGGGAWYDPSDPPGQVVTDAITQGEVSKYLLTHPFGSTTIHEVFVGPAYYADNGAGGTSCGGPNLQFCAYHSLFSSNGNLVTYAIVPYPSCGGCLAGFSAVEGMEHFSTHETREAITDPYFDGWWNSTNGEELDDQCAWDPSPFADGGFAYQYEWSNAASACVRGTVHDCSPVTVVKPPADITVSPGRSFATRFEANGGAAPFSFFGSGILPSGVRVFRDGTLEGLPVDWNAAAGSYPLTVTAVDQFGCQGTSTGYSLHVGSAGSSNLYPQNLLVEGRAPVSGSAEPNGIIEPGEQFSLVASWFQNPSSNPGVPFSGMAAHYGGPGNAALYSIPDGSATYEMGAHGSCSNALLNDCYRLALGRPIARPRLHWDSQVVETLSDGTQHSWLLHVGRSFTDVASSNPFYPYVENVLHHGVTLGCGATTY